MTNDTVTSNPIAFPRLEAHDLAILKSLSDIVSFSDGQIIFRAGDVDLDLFVVETGGIKILNPSDENRHLVTHGPGQFAGDIDLLTHRPVIVTGVASGQTQLLRIQATRLHEILSKVPHLAEMLLIAIQERRRLLLATGVVGLKIVGPGKCRDTMLIREFLFKNFVPFTWYDSTSEKSCETLPISAVFVFIGADPGCSWLPETLARDSLGYIMTGIDALQSGNWPLKNREPCTLETTIPGILAAGDIRSGSTKRVGFAVGVGSMAVTCVHQLVAIRA